MSGVRCILRCNGRAASVAGEAHACCGLRIVWRARLSSTLRAQPLWPSETPGASQQPLVAHLANACRSADSTQPIAKSASAEAE